MRRPLARVCKFVVSLGLITVISTVASAIVTAPTSIDPLFHGTTPDNLVAPHMFDRLVVRDAKSKLVPSAATEWRLASNTIWEFKLRPEVKRHDGVLFTAADVVATLPVRQMCPTALSASARFWPMVGCRIGRGAAAPNWAD